MNHFADNDGLPIRCSAWLCSLLLHGLVFGVTLLSMKYVTWESFLEPFRLEVTLVGSTDLNRDRNLPADDQNTSLLENQTGPIRPTEDSAPTIESDVAAPRRTLQPATVKEAPQQIHSPPVFEGTRSNGLNQEVPVATEPDIPSKPEQSEQASLRPSIDGSSMFEKVSSKVSSSVIDEN
jgi:hypothetical protein